MVQQNNIPFGKLLKADLQLSVMVSMLVSRDVQETLCNMKGPLVYGGGNASLKLHLEQLSIRRILAEDMFQTLNLVLHSQNCYFQRRQLNLFNKKDIKKQQL